MGNLLRRQPAVQTKTRHVGAGGDGIRVIDLVIDVLDGLLRIAANRAEMLQARTNRAVRQA